MSIRFADLNLSPILLSNVAAEGYETATPIQAQAIPAILACRDVLGSAQTGTGKTAAFALPMLHLLAESAGKGAKRSIRGLVLCPTRELALQIEESLRTYGRGTGLRHVVVFGGVNQNPQVRALRQGVDILVATPGRLEDLMAQGHIDLRQVEMLVLDEADRMLDMGFIPAIRRIAAIVPQNRQTLLFSATVPPSIKSLVASLLKNPERVEIKSKTSSADQIEQGVYFVDKRNKPQLLAHLVKTHGIKCGIVFSRTKHGADRVVRQLAREGIEAAAIHGNKTQNNRQKALQSFRSGRTPILVATDVAARGIDVDGITHVINYDLTHEPETYVHRIGRTGRAGATGIALSFCDREERPWLRDIQKLLKRDLAVRDDHPVYTSAPQENDFIVERPARHPHQPKPARQGQSNRPSRNNDKPAGRPRNGGQGGQTASAPSRDRWKPKGQGAPSGKPSGGTGRGAKKTGFSRAARKRAAGRA